MNGLTVENFIKANLLKKCQLEEDPTYDHKYKIDFVISKIKSIDWYIPAIGVQVTTRPDDAQKQVEFLKERRKKTLVDRSLYIKVQPSVDIEKWGTELIYNAIVAFAFQEDLKNRGDVVGVLIKNDKRYEFFELRDDHVESLTTPGPAVKNELSHEKLLSEKIPQTGSDLVTDTHLKEGYIESYKSEKRFGKIVNGSEKYFLHISNVSDDKLRKMLLDAEIGDFDRLLEPIKVKFEDFGYTRAGALHPTAGKITLN